MTRTVTPGMLLRHTEAISTSYYTPQAERAHVESHQAHVAAGRCSSVHWTKAWCNGKAGHPEPHHAPYLLPSGDTKQTFWHDDDGCPCPA